MTATTSPLSTSAETISQHSNPRRQRVLLLLLVLLLTAFTVSLMLGSVRIPLDQIVTILLGGEPTRATWTTIVLDFRLPKALTALLAGAALAVGGLQMQTLFRNPLAEPYVLGINAGASLGVALVVLAVGGTGSMLLAGIGLAGDLGIAAAAFIGAAVALLIVLTAAARVQSVTTLLILGLMFGFAVSAVVSLLLYFSIAERVQAYINWTFGSFGGVTWSQMPIFASMIVAGLAGAVALTKSLNALLLGEHYARSLGVSVRQVRLGIVLSAALLTGSVTAFCGPIGFIGIAVPHLCRSLLHTADHRALIPAAALLGGLVALLADVVAQMPGGQVVLPLNAVMALLGAPIIIAVILRRRNLRTAFAS